MASFLSIEPKFTALLQWRLVRKQLRTQIVLQVAIQREPHTALGQGRKWLPKSGRASSNEGSIAARHLLFCLNLEGGGANALPLFRPLRGERLFIKLQAQNLHKLF